MAWRQTVRCPPCDATAGARHVSPVSSTISKLATGNVCGRWKYKRQQRLTDLQVCLATISYVHWGTTLQEVTLSASIMTYGAISHGATGVRAAVDQTYNRKTLHLIGLGVVMIEYKKMGSMYNTYHCLGGMYSVCGRMTRAPGCFRGAMLGLPLQVSTHATPWYRRSGTWIELHFEKGFARVCPRSQ